MNETQDRLDQIRAILGALSEGEQKYLEGQLAISNAAQELRSKVKTGKEFFAKINRNHLTSAQKKQFLNGSYDYGLKDIAALEAWRCEILQERYVELASKHATIIKTFERVKAK